jgi:5-oxoprolinase (ATP-hydrolysing)
MTGRGHGDWEFWIDRGGTFTDVIAAAPDGRLLLRKVPSAVAGGGADPGVAAALDLLATEGIGPDAARAFKVGTTVATNALLERRGSRVLLVTTRGFGDALLIGRQDRPDLFARRIRRETPLFARVLEVDERVAADGTVLRAPDLHAARAALAAALQDGCDSIAIVLLHGWRHTAHEAALAAVARELRFAHVAVSHELVALERLVPRGDTTVFDAYLGPALRAYVDRLEREVHRAAPRATLHFMQSAGGLTGSAGFRAASSVLSGPAGGLVGMAAIGRASGLARLIGFDMGGTSTDVSLYDGGFERRFEHRIAGARLATPMLDIHTIAAGGGSVLALRDGRCQVGPESAGAEPGPACYGRGGPATLTDVQVLLGRVSAATMPRVFGPQRTGPLDTAAAQRALAQLAKLAPVGPASSRTPDAAIAATAADYLDVAIASMANAIRHVSVRQGLDPAEFTLVAFGGAAGQHACRVAAACGMSRVLVHPLASVLSAYGIGVADWIDVRRHGLTRPLDAAGWREAEALLRQLEAEARAALAAQGTPCAAGDAEWICELRAAHSENGIDVAGRSVAELCAGFAAAHRRRFGYAAPLDTVTIVAVRVEARHRPRHRPGSAVASTAMVGLPPTARAWFGDWRQVPVLEARAVRSRVDGPALLVEPHSTFVLEPGWSVEPAADGALLARLDAAATGGATRAKDPARIEIFNGLFMHVAVQMGEVLRRTAQSVNIKERLDFSCAVFDAAGGLVANAPHMPVHLGSMGITVRALLQSRRGCMQRGDAWLVNSPWHGGTHLPDLTLVSPVFATDGAEPDFFVASRAHHADIGGITPGSMPPFSRSIDDEGTLFADFALLDRGRFREAELRAALASGAHPARNADQNVADLLAQLAANERGSAELLRAAREHGAATLATMMQAVQDNGAECVRAAIAALGARVGEFRVEMDSGPVIVVRVTLDPGQRQARIDFTGTSAAGPHNFNAPRAVCIAAVLYVFRTLVERDMPLNEGCLRPLQIVIPAGSLLDPPPGCAVVAGNVETSQALVDALYGALGLLAAAQGTMNNLTFGDATLQYYETIAGGSGAGPDFDGADAVQTHMTNSRLTDAEILETRFPVRVLEFSVRRGSGGAGRQRGGDGAVRRLEFLAPMQASMLAGRRRIAPFGLAGGNSAATGVTRIVRVDGPVEIVASSATFAVSAGDILEVLTPGGGGFGAALGAAPADAGANPERTR